MIFIWALKNLRKVAILLTSSYKSHVLYPKRSGLVGISIHLRSIFPTSILKSCIWHIPGSSCNFIMNTWQQLSHQIRVSTCGCHITMKCARFSPFLSTHRTSSQTSSQIFTWLLNLLQLRISHFLSLSYIDHSPVSSVYCILIGDSKLVVLPETVDLMGFLNHRIDCCARWTHWVALMPTSPQPHIPTTYSEVAHEQVITHLLNRKNVPFRDSLCFSLRMKFNHIVKKRAEVFMGFSAVT